VDGKNREAEVLESTMRYLMALQLNPKNEKERIVAQTAAKIWSMIEYHQERVGLPKGF
jgi:hypothetical protein